MQHKAADLLAGDINDVRERKGEEENETETTRSRERRGWAALERYSDTTDTCIRTRTYGNANLSQMCLSPACVL